MFMETKSVPSFLRGLTKVFGDISRIPKRSACETSPSNFRPVRSSHCSARAVAARRPHCVASPVWSVRMPVRIRIGDAILHDPATGTSVPLNRQRHRHGVSVLRHLAAHDGVREYRVSSAGLWRHSVFRGKKSAPSSMMLWALSGSRGYGDRPATRLSGGQQRNASCLPAPLSACRDCCRWMSRVIKSRRGTGAGGDADRTPPSTTAD